MMSNPFATAASSIHWIRRWLRFSLRTFFLLLTLFAVWLGVMTHRAREQGNAVSVINSLGGTVQYDYEFEADWNFLPHAKPPGPKWLRGVIGPDFGTNVVIVNYWRNGTPGIATDKDLSVLLSLPRLRDLRLGSSPAITDDGLKNIGRLSRLESLDLSDTGITDDGLAHLSHSGRLSYLFLVRCGIDGSGLRHLRHLPLKHLNLNWTRLVDANLGHVGEMKSLESLTMQDTPITDNGLAQIAGLKDLWELHIHNTAVTGDGLSHLESLTKLRELQVPTTNVSKEDFAKLKQAIPGLP